MKGKPLLAGSPCLKLSADANAHNIPIWVIQINYLDISIHMLVRRKYTWLILCRCCVALQRRKRKHSSALNENKHPPQFEMCHTPENVTNIQRFGVLFRMQIGVLLQTNQQISEFIMFYTRYVWWSFLVNLKVRFVAFECWNMERKKTEENRERRRRRTCA